MKALLILNAHPYGTEHSYNGLRLAISLKKEIPEIDVNVFLIGDAVSCAISGQKTSSGYYNLERMIRALVTKKVTMKCRETCFDAPGPD
ncbi:MAG: DsrE/DsrF/TusD sulfur relay family protein [Candidatus Thorarchaeota archaeon]